MQTGKPSDHTQPDTDVESNEYRIPRGTNTLRNVQREAVRLEASESNQARQNTLQEKLTLLLGQEQMRRRDPRKRNAKLNLSKGLLHLSEVGLVVCLRPDTPVYYF
jgi:hypothetical protein